MSDPQEDIVVTRSGRLRGCRGRVLVAVIVVVLLVLLMLAFLVSSMVSETQPMPQPRRRAAVEEVPAAVYGTLVRADDLTAARGSSAVAQPIVEARPIARVDLTQPASDAAA